MRYQEYAPSLHLRPTIDKFWTLETDASDSYPMELLLTPNGAEGFIIHPKKPDYKVIINNQLFDVSETNVIMPYTPWKVLVAGPTQAIGLFFKAGSLHTLLKSSMASIVNQVIELEAFLGSRVVRVLRQQVAEATPEKGIILMEQFFSNYFCNNPYVVNTVGCGVQLIRQNNGKLSIEQIAARLGISRQAIARQFAEKVGISPKYYSRIIHFNAVYQFLKKKSSYLLD